MAYLNPADHLPDPKAFLDGVTQFALTQGYDAAAAEFVDCGFEIALSVTKSSIQRAIRRKLPCEAAELVSELDIWFAEREAA